MDVIKPDDMTRDRLDKLLKRWSNQMENLLQQNELVQQEIIALLGGVVSSGEEVKQESPNANNSRVQASPSHQRCLAPKLIPHCSPLCDGPHTADMPALPTEATETQNSTASYVMPDCVKPNLPESPKFEPGIMRSQSVICDMSRDERCSEQFARLADIHHEDGLDLLTGSALLQLMEEFLGHGHALENLAAIHSYCEASEEETMEDLKTNSVSVRKTRGSVKFGIGGFIMLRSPEVLQETDGSLKRDIGRLQEALRLEERQAMYSNDYHMDLGPDWSGRDFSRKTGAASEFIPQFLEGVPAFVIVLNAITFGLSADIDPDSTVWQLLEICFTAFYLVEAVLKMYLLTIKGYFLGEEKYWNWLDFSCLALSIVDIPFTFAAGSSSLGNTSILRLLRLARLARLLKALRYKFFSELKLMVMGVISGMRGLSWGFVMLMSIIYIVALGMNKIFGAEEEEFQTVVSSMSTLFRCFTDGCSDYNGAPLPERLLKKYSWPFMLGYVIIYMWVAVGVFNLIMALFIDNVMNSQAQRKQEEISSSADKVEVELKACLSRLLLMSRSNGVPASAEEEIRALNLHNKAALIRSKFAILCSADIGITRDAFDVWLEDQKFCDILELADIDINNKVALFDIMDADAGGSLSPDEVYSALMKMRGPVTKGDIIYISVRVRQLISTLKLHKFETL